MDTALVPKALFSIHLENRKHHKFTDLLDSNTGKRMEMKSNSFMFSHIFHFYAFYICSQKMSLVFCNSIAYLVSIKHQSSENLSKGFQQPQHSCCSTGLVRHITHNQQMVQRRQQPLKDSGDLLLRVMEDGWKFGKKNLLKMFLLSLNI